MRNETKYIQKKIVVMGRGYEGVATAMVRMTARSRQVHFRCRETCSALLAVK
jgi:hypothetical protein